MDYIAYLHKDRDSDFGVTFPTFRAALRPGRRRRKRGGWPPKPWRRILRAWSGTERLFRNRNFGSGQELCLHGHRRA
jgi:hypothetical protein